MTQIYFIRSIIFIKCYNQIIWWNQLLKQVFGLTTSSLICNVTTFLGGWVVGGWGKLKLKTNSVKLKLKLRLSLTIRYNLWLNDDSLFPKLSVISIKKNPSEIVCEKVSKHALCFNYYISRGGVGGLDPRWSSLYISSPKIQ